MVYLIQNPHVNSLQRRNFPACLDVSADFQSRALFNFKQPSDPRYALTYYEHIHLESKAHSAEMLKYLLLLKQVFHYEYSSKEVYFFLTWEPPGVLPIFGSKPIHAVLLPSKKTCQRNFRDLSGKDACQSRAWEKEKNYSSMIL